MVAKADRNQQQEMSAEEASEKDMLDALLQDDLLAGEESSYDIPRPALNLNQAAQILGKSLRSLERSLVGKWGNKLPNGWSAKKVTGDSGQQEWRIIPPPGFRLRQVAQESDGAAVYADEETTEESFTVEAIKNIRRRLPFRPENNSIEHPSIVIDRSEEVERLLRELVVTQKALSEERRLRMEDLRLMTQMQSSMRLLEVNAQETGKLKEELNFAKQEFQAIKQQYLAIINAPWWKRLFGTGK